ncbi:MAG TPA: zinc-dependent metalloprotease [Acidimicrobiales bacterium]|nr:zinc-dependent metalloprotease [Acidimicrobiales bacterium]
MSSPTPGGNPFDSLFAQLGRMLSTEGPVNWEMARQFARMSAAEGEAEANVEPVERIRLEELVRVADLHVADVTGLPTSVTGRALSVAAVGRSGWASSTLDHWKPLLTALGEALRADTGPGGAPGEGDGEMDDALQQMLGPLLPGLQAAFLGLQLGSMVGSLAQRALGQYDLPIPRPESDEVMVVPANLAAFASDWSLPADDVRLWVCLSEVTHHSVLGRPHVRRRLTDLLVEFVGAFDPSPAIEERLGQVDPSDLESLQRVLGDPAALFGESHTDRQLAIAPELQSLIAVVEGYVDHVVDTAGRRLIASYGPLTEALRRRRVERGQGERLVERLLGVELRQEQYDRGTRFVSGVIERAGDDGLARLWSSATTLPTPPEVDAPGLWLERISFDEAQDGG